MLKQRKIARYGWRRDHPDWRDRIYNLEETILHGHQLPDKIDLESEMPPVYDQGQLGSCTANAACALLEHQQMKQGEGAQTPSRLFVYYEERRIEGQPLDQDTGAEVRDGIKVLVSEGAPAESDWPYDVSRFADMPPRSCYTNATAHEATAYKRIVIGQPGAPMRSALAAGNPIAFGFSVPAYFEDPSWNPARQPLPLPGRGDQFIGGHAVVIVGYDFTRTEFRETVFRVRNSWGSGWGDQGHYYMDSRWFDPWRGLADDLWIVSHVK